MLICLPQQFRVYNLVDVDCHFCITENVWMNTFEIILQFKGDHAGQNQFTFLSATE